MISNSIIILIKDVLLLNLDDNTDKRMSELRMSKADIGRIIFRDECGKNVECNLARLNTETKFYETCFVTVSIKNAKGELGFIVHIPAGPKYTIVNDVQILNAMKAEYIKAEMVNKYIQILNMDTEALSNLEFEEVEDDDYDKIDVRPI